MSDCNETLDQRDLVEDQSPSDDQDPADDQDTFTDPPRQKRNCGKTGATSIAGRRRCSMNALKHGACSGTHFVNGESEDEWLLVLHQWREGYAPPEALTPCPSGNPEAPAISECECPSCLFDRSAVCALVVKVAEAEWYRRRSQRALNSFVHATGGGPNINWTPEQHKTYGLFLRYKTADERKFTREFRELQDYIKTHPGITPPEPKKRPSKPEPEPEPELPPHLSFVAEDPDSPTGFSCVREHPPLEGVVYPYPVPRPAGFPDLYYPDADNPHLHKKDDPETG